MRFGVAGRKNTFSSLQLRQKWLKPQRDLRIDDIVLIKDDCLARNHWQLAHVSKTNQDAHGATHPCRSRPKPQGSSFEAITRSREANTQAGVLDDKQPGGRTRTGVYPRQGAMNILF